MKTDPIPCCAMLRCKSMYYRPDERPGKLHESDVMPHWCLRTQSLLGPDDGVAKPSACQPGRHCYRADREETV
jgi:hypothetical protein